MRGRLLGRCLWRAFHEYIRLDFRQPLLADTAYSHKVFHAPKWPALLAVFENSVRDHGTNAGKLLQFVGSRGI